MLGRIFELIIVAAIIFWIIGFVMRKWGGDSDTKESTKIQKHMKIFKTRIQNKVKLNSMRLRKM